MLEIDALRKAQRSDEDTAVSYHCAEPDIAPPGQAQLGRTPFANAFREIRDTVDGWVGGLSWLASIVSLFTAIVNAPLLLWFKVTVWLAIPFGVVTQLAYPLTTVVADVGGRLILALALVLVGFRLLIQLPSRRRATRSGVRMQVIRPQLADIQRRHRGKKDEESRKSMTEESFQLYKKYRTNPLSSCGVGGIFLMALVLTGLWNFIKGLTVRATDGTFAPEFISRRSSLYYDLSAASNLTAFNMDLTASILQVGACAATSPYLLAVACISIIRLYNARKMLSVNPAILLAITSMEVVFFLLVPALLLVLRLIDAIYMVVQTAHLGRYRERVKERLRRDPDFIQLLGDISSSGTPRTSSTHPDETPN